MTARARRVIGALPYIPYENKKKRTFYNLNQRLNWSCKVLKHIREVPLASDEKVIREEEEFFTFFSFARLTLTFMCTKLYSAEFKSFTSHIKFLRGELRARERIYLRSFCFGIDERDIFKMNPSIKYFYMI